MKTFREIQRDASLMSFLIHGNEQPKSRFAKYHTRKTNRRYGAILKYVRAVLSANKLVTSRQLVPPLTMRQAVNALLKLEHNKEAKIVRHGHGGRYDSKPTVYRANAELCSRSERSASANG